MTNPLKEIKREDEKEKRWILKWKTKWKSIQKGLKSQPPINGVVLNSNFGS